MLTCIKVKNLYPVHAEMSRIFCTFAPRIRKTKSTMARMISRQSAAELLDCTTQTVTNWVKRGLINGHQINGSLMVDRDSILQYFDSLKDLVNMEQKIMDMKRKLKERTEERKAVLDEVCGNTLLLKETRELFRESQMTLINLFDNILKDREREIIKKIAIGEKVEDIAAHYDLHPFRVLQIGAKAAAKISNMADLKRLVEEKEKLKIENEKLEIENQDLKRQIAHLNDILKVYSHRHLG